MATNVEHKIPSKIMNVLRMEVGTRGRGRPKRRWLDCMKEELLAVGAAEEDAQDRGKWKRLIRTGDPSNGNKA